MAISWLGRHILRGETKSVCVSVLPWEILLDVQVSFWWWVHLNRNLINSICLSKYPIAFVLAPRVMNIANMAWCQNNQIVHFLVSREKKKNFGWRRGMTDAWHLGTKSAFFNENVKKTVFRTRKTLLLNYSTFRKNNNFPNNLLNRKSEKNIGMTTSFLECQNS